MSKICLSLMKIKNFLEGRRVFLFIRQASIRLQLNLVTEIRICRDCTASFRGGKERRRQSTIFSQGEIRR